MVFAGSLRPLKDQHAGKDFEIITLLGTVGGDTPPTDLAAWADKYDLNHPVLADPDHTYLKFVWPPMDDGYFVDNKALVLKNAVLYSKQDPPPESVGSHLD